jgi:hypothetical protein
MFVSYGDKFEAVSVNDVAVDDISQHLRGIDAVIHAAAPMPREADRKALMDASVSPEIDFKQLAYKTFSSGCLEWIFECHTPGRKIWYQENCLYQFHCDRYHPSIHLH